MDGPLEAARETILPPLGALCAVLEQEGSDEALAFFDPVRVALGRIREEEDLADLFMQLSTSAFLGFQYSAPAAELLDQVLEAAARLAQTLSADPAEIH